MHDSLGDRMKSYEKAPQQLLISRMPVLIRLDGKAFHTYTKVIGSARPLDDRLHRVRTATLKYLCENIQGVLFGYSQSDEISLVLKDWDTFQTQAWFGNKIQKMLSVSASMCTMIWNMEMGKENPSYNDQVKTLAVFDSRVWNIPREEVINYLLWRQQDWERNSVQLNAQYHYSHKSLQNKSCKELIAQMEKDLGFVWGNEVSWKKRGEFWVRGEGIVDTPPFKTSRGYLETLLNKENENV
jgi:tRNA(His) guanylyltransferase